MILLSALPITSTKSPAVQIPASTATFSRDDSPAPHCTKSARLAASPKPESFI